MTSVKAPIGAAAGVILAAASMGTANAEDLTIALAAEPSSMDPHFHNLGPNNAMRSHIFESLVWQDAQQLLEPQLAEILARGRRHHLGVQAARRASSSTTAPTSTPRT